MFKPTEFARGCDACTYAFGGEDPSRLAGEIASRKLADQSASRWETDGDVPEIAMVCCHMNGVYTKKEGFKNPTPMWIISRISVAPW